MHGSSFITITEDDLKVSLMGFEFATLSQEVKLQGHWTFKGNPVPKNRLQVKISGELGGLGPSLPTDALDSWRGTYAVDGEVAGTLTNPKVSWVFDSKDFAAQDIPIGDLLVSGAADLETVNIANLTLSGPSGTVQGTVDYEFASKSVEAELNSDGLKLENIFKLVDSPPVVRGAYTGTITGNGTIAPLELNADLQGSFYNLDINDGNDFPIVQLPVLASQIRTQITDRRITIERATLDQKNLSIQTFGDITLRPEVMLNLTSNISNISLKPLSPIVGLEFGGAGQAAVSVDGPPEDITVSGSARLKKFELEGLRFGSVRSALLYKDRKIELPNLTLQRDSGTARGKVIVDIDTPGLDAELNFEDIALNPLLADLDLAPELLPYVQGDVSGDVTLQGPLSELGIALDATGKNLLFDPLEIQSGKIVAVRPQGDKTTFKINVESINNQNDTASVAIDADSRLDIDLQLRDYPFSRFHIPALENRQGEFDVSVGLKGPVDSLSGQVAFDTRSLGVRDIKLGNGNGEFRFERGIFNGTVAFPEQSLSMTSKGEVGETIPVNSTIQFEDLRPIDWVDPQTDIDLMVTGSVFLQGDLTNIPAITADANISSASLGWSGISGTLERPAVLSYAEEKFRVAELDLNLDGLNVSAMGEIPIEGSQSLQLRLLGSAGAVAPLFGPLDNLTGLLDGFIDVSGELAEPQFSGNIMMSNLSGRQPTLGLSFSEGFGRLSLIDRDIVIDSATLKTGDGSVNILGKATFLPSFKPELQLTLDRTLLRPYPSSQAVVSGQLQLTQDRQTSITGALEVNSATYGENIDLSRLFIRQPNMSFGADIDDEPWELRVQLSAPDGIFVRNNLVEAELRADLTVRGNTKKMGLIGSVVPLNGTVSYGGNQFDVESGSFDFTDEYAVRPNYATKLSAEACGMDLQVNLSGEAERFIVEASGEDETGVVDARDALLCAQFGIRSAERGISTDQQGSGLKDSLPGAVDALWRVSGMDERVRRYLPVVDEFKLTSGYSRSSKQTEPRLLVIKELGRQWELKYNGPVNESDEQHVLGLEYRLKRGLVLEGSWVSVSEATAGDLGLDLRMDWEFD